MEFNVGLGVPYISNNNLGDTMVITNGLLVFWRLVKEFFWSLLYTRFVQWVSRRVTGGWCFIRENDSRFVCTADEFALRYDGDHLAIPDQGISNQRKEWRVWTVFSIPKMAHRTFYVVIDTYDSRRLICLKNLKGESDVPVAIRVGHEPGIIRIAMRWDPTSIGQRSEMAQSSCLWPIILCRWQVDNEWPLDDTKKSTVQFI